MTKTYNTPKRHHIIKTRLNDEEYEHFQRRLEVYGMNQSAFIRKSLSDAIIRPVIVASLVNDDLLAALGELTAERRMEEENGPFETKYIYKILLKEK